VEISVDIRVAARVAPVIAELLWPDLLGLGTLPPVHENLGKPRGFLRGKFLP
jgi:hypothetical protein